MSQIRIKDNSYYSKENFSYISHLTEKIADKTLEQLEKEGIFVFPELIKESDDITKDQMILQSINDVYQSSNVMGFLGLGKEKLIDELNSYGFNFNCDELGIDKLRSLYYKKECKSKNQNG